MLKANSVIQALNTFSGWNFQIHGHTCRAGLVFKATFPNLAYQEGNISMPYQRRAQVAEYAILSYSI